MNETLYIQSGNEVHISVINGDVVDKKLRPKIYSVSYHEFKGYYLTTLKDKFVIPTEIYGSGKSGIVERVKKIKHAYETRPSSTGILLTGSKGSGKTLLAEKLCNEMIDSGLPVIIINTKYTSQPFIEFLESIGEAVFFFDEFGKTYREKNAGYNSENTAQEALLTFFDGTQSSKRLILLTENNKSYISDYMINRPGRIFYHFEYEKISPEIVDEYCQKKNIAEEIKRVIKDYYRRIADFSFDMLKAIVEEHKRSNDDIESIVKDLNIDVITSKEELVIMKLESTKRPEVKLTPLAPEGGYEPLGPNNIRLYIDYRSDEKFNNESDIPQNSEVDEDEVAFSYPRSLVFQEGNKVIYESGKMRLYGEIRERKLKFTFL